MKATIGIYDSMEKADQAIQKLVSFDFPADKLSVFGKHAGEVVEGEENEVVEDDAEPSVEPQDKTAVKVATSEVVTAAVAGAGIGALAGLGVLAIPGLGFLVGAGALVGAIAGFDFGIIGGGIASALTVAGISKHKADEYAKHLHEGKFLLIVTGEEEEIIKAKEILIDHGTHVHVEHH